MTHKRRDAARIAGLVMACLATAGCAGQQPLELECMDRFDIDTYVLGCWAWPSRDASDPKSEKNRAYWRALRDDGFSAFTSGNSKAGMMRHIKGPVFDKLSYDLDFIQKLGIKALVDADHWAVWHLRNLHEKVGTHPAVLGYWMSDDNADLYQHNIDVAWWLSEYAPDRVPWMTANPNPIPQSRCRMPVISTQNYAWMYRPHMPEDYLQHGFNDTCEANRLLANRYDMVAWTIMSTTSSPSQYRFQINAPAAHGAQGVWLFVYGDYARVALRRAMRPANNYLVKIAGPYLLGRRCIEVLHTGKGAPGETYGPGPGKLIEKMDDGLMAGLLTPDAKFQAGVLDADCIYIVDKRTRKFEERTEVEKLCRTLRADPDAPVPARAKQLVAKMYAEDPGPRRSHITFGPKVRAAEALLPDGSVRKYDLTASREIELPPLRGGGAVLLRIKAEPVKIIRIPEDTAVERVPFVWKFRVDTKNVAEKEKWAGPGFDDAEWKEAKVPFYLGWKRQNVGPHNGNGWYRVRWAIPEKMRKKHIYLHFGAADEQAWVYADGKLVVENSCAARKMTLGRLWHIPFHADVSGVFKDGKEHTLAVRVLNQGGCGGLVEPVYLIASDEPLDADQLWRVHKRENANWEWLWQ